ncbi:hypothetical protein BB559_007374, partial [Furculomyces boomerangus]
FSGCHYAGISAVDYSKNTSMVALGSLDTRVSLWDAESGKELYKIEGHSDIIRGVQFYDKYLITSANDGRVRMWDLDLAKSVIPVEYLDLDGNYLNPDHNNIEPQNETDTSNKGVVDRVSDFSYFSPSHKTKRESASLISKENTAAPFISRTSTTPLVSPSIALHVAPMELCCETTFVGHQGAVTCFEAHNGLLISGSADGSIREWDLNTGLLIQRLDVLWSLNQNQSSRLTMKKNQTSGESENGGFKGNEFGAGGYIGALQFYGPALATGTYDGVVQMWDRRTGQVVRSFTAHSDEITSLKFNDNSLITSSLDCTVAIWDLRSTKLTQRVRFDDVVTSVSLDDSFYHSLGSNSRQRNDGYKNSLWITTPGDSLYHYSPTIAEIRGFSTTTGELTSRRQKIALGDLDLPIISPSLRSSFSKLKTGSKNLFTDYGDNSFGSQLQNKTQGKKSENTISPVSIIQAKTINGTNRQLLTGSIDGTATLWSV